MNFSELYYLDQRRSEFIATVLACEEAGEGKFALELDCTCFYPEGGGQVGDRGVLEISDSTEVKILDTFFRDSTIIHLADKSIAIGKQVRGIVDFERRFDLMQQHSGEHIVSGLVFQRYGYNNVGFHLTDQYMSFDFDGPLNASQLAEIERQANVVIQQNVPVEIIYPTSEELRHLKYRSKKILQSPVRIVRIQDADTCACCGTHVSLTGEIGLLVFERWEKYKSGIRIFASCGQRAVRYVQEQREILQQAAAKFSTHYSQIPEAIERQKGEVRSIVEVKKRLVQQVIDDHLAEIQRMEQIRNLSLVGTTAERMYFSHEVWITDLLSSSEAGSAALALAQYLPRFAMVMIPESTEVFYFALAAQDINLRAKLPQLRDQINLKGGGSEQLVTGKVMGDSDKIIAKIEEILLEEC